MKKIISALTGLVTSPGGLSFTVLVGVVLFNLLNTYLPPEYFGAVAIVAVLIVIVALFAVIADIDNSSAHNVVDNNLPARDDDMLSKTRDITSTWYETDSKHV